MPWLYDAFNDVWKQRGNNPYAPHKNLAPIVNFTHNASNLDAVFDGTYSYDLDGTIVGWVWNFGDGSGATGPQVAHTYRAAGSYSVLLAVTDNTGLSSSKSTIITVTAPVVVNQRPTALFTYTTGGTTDPYRLNVNASGSKDSDGSIAKYHWDFGNASTFDTTNPIANGFYYTADGTYKVTLTVTDDDGATASTSQLVTVKSPTTPPSNQSPGAAFTATAAGLTANVDGSPSSDPDGNLTAWAWVFGDGATATGITASHTYAAAGTYTITLTVTDDVGATSSTSKPFTASTSSNTPYVIDDGLGTNSGAEPTGRVSYGTVAGSSFVRRAQAAGNIMSVPAGTFILPGFTSVPNNADHEATSSKGFIGAGSSRTLITMTANTSSGAAYTSSTNPYQMLRLDSPGSGLVQDAKITGTAQTVADNSGKYTSTAPKAKASNIYGGLMLTGNNWTLRRVKVIAVPGTDKAPPGETFGISAFKAYGTLTLDDVEINGNGRGASNFGINGSGTASTVPTTLLKATRLWTHGNEFSGGIAFWQTVFDSASFMDDCVFDDSRCFWNVERCSGTITINRPRIGALKAWPVASDWANGSIAGAVGIFCEADATWGAAAAQAFRWIVRDPRNMNGTPYTGPKIPVNFGSANDRGTNYYGRNNFKCYNAGGTDISSTFYTYGGTPYN